MLRQTVVGLLVTFLVLSACPAFCQEGEAAGPGMVAWDLVNLGSYAWKNMKLNLNQRMALLNTLVEMYEQGDPATREEMERLAAKYAGTVWMDEDQLKALYKKVKAFYKGHDLSKSAIEGLASAPLPTGIAEVDDDTDFIAWNLTRAAVRAYETKLALEQLNALYAALAAHYQNAGWQAQTPLKNLAGDEFGILKKWEAQRAGFPMRVRITLGGLGLDVPPIRPLDEPMQDQTAQKMAMAYGNLAIGLKAVDRWWVEEAQHRLEDGQHQTETCEEAGVEEEHPEMMILLAKAEKLEHDIANLEQRRTELIASAAEPSQRLKEYADTIFNALKDVGDEEDMIKRRREAMAILPEAEEFAAEYRRIFPDIALVMQLSNEAQNAGVDGCLETIDNGRANLSQALGGMIPGLLEDANEALAKAKGSDNTTLMSMYAGEVRATAELVLEIDAENQQANALIEETKAIDAKVDSIMEAQVAQNRMPEETRTGGEWDAVKQAITTAWGGAFPNEPIKRIVITSDFLEQAELHFEGNVAVVRHYRYITAYVAAQQEAGPRVFRTQFRSVWTGDAWSALSYYKTAGSYAILSENIDK